MIRTLIIEDEVNAFEYLKTILLKVEPEIEVIANIDSVQGSLNYLANNKLPDLIFLDIQLADGLSFEIFNHIDLSIPIIFTTAFDQYAIDAFKVHSIDYLLKPIDQEDLLKSITKYKNLYRQSDANTNDNLKELFASVNQRKKNRCLVKKGGHFEYINVDNISFVSSEDSITFIYTEDGRRHIYSKTVESLFAELDHVNFYQINRSQIVRDKAINEIHPYLNQRLKIKLKKVDDARQEFVVSRQRASDFKSWLDS